MTHILFNPWANNNRGEQAALELGKLLGEPVEYIDITTVKHVEFLTAMPKEDRAIFVGGDGTLNYLVNALGGKNIDRDIYYYPAGSGNDFTSDMGKGDENGLTKLDKYICSLPTVTINGKTSYFINGIGYGIDGYCCEVGDKLREQPGKKINYTSIAIKGLLFFFKPTKATVTVDGVTRQFHHVWLAPTMNGRFYGGGMNIAPTQDRLNPERTVTTVVMHCRSRLKTLIVFPSVFKGEHIKHTDIVDIMSGREVTVSFDRPTALQIDGETILNVTSYSVKAGAAAESSADAAFAPAG